MANYPSGSGKVLAAGSMCHTGKAAQCRGCRQLPALPWLCFSRAFALNISFAAGCCLQTSSLGPAATLAVVGVTRSWHSSGTHAQGQLCPLGRGAFAASCKLPADAGCTGWFLACSQFPSPLGEHGAVLREEAQQAQGTQPPQGEHPGRCWGSVSLCGAWSGEPEVPSRPGSWLAQVLAVVRVLVRVLALLWVLAQVWVLAWVLALVWVLVPVLALVRVLVQVLALVQVLVWVLALAWVLAQVLALAGAGGWQCGEG